MALTKPAENIVQWAAANTIDVPNNNSSTSDTHTISDTAIRAWLRISADNQGTPATEDELHIYILYSIDGTNFSTADEKYGEFLQVLDTFANDPVQKLVQIDHVPKFFRIFAFNKSSGRLIRLQVDYLEQRG